MTESAASLPSSIDPDVIEGSVTFLKEADPSIGFALTRTFRELPVDSFKALFISAQCIEHVAERRRMLSRHQD
jgi:hypothetical protein